jgi:hypothetical protein
MQLHGATNEEKKNFLIANCYLDEESDCWVWKGERGLHGPIYRDDSGAFIYPRNWLNYNLDGRSGFIAVYTTTAECPNPKRCINRDHLCVVDYRAKARQAAVPTLDS